MRRIARIAAAAASFMSSSTSVLRHPVCSGLRAEWIPVPREGYGNRSSGSRTLQPRRSGHVSFRHDGGEFSAGSEAGEPNVYVFGGYAEVDAKDSGSKERFVVNDLWRWHQDHRGEGTVDGGWVPVNFGPQDMADEEGEASQTCGSSESSSPIPPRARLVSAAAVLDDHAYVIGGWDPGVPGTGGEILASCHRLGPLSAVASQTVDEQDNVEASATRVASKKAPLEWTRLPDFPDGPTSRHVAVTLPPRGDSSGRIVVHNHRCVNHVWVLDAASSAAASLPTFVKQPTQGDAPSPRGLHAATVVGKDKVVVFGGAAQEGTMSNEIFVLDASTWTWTKPRVSGSSNEDVGGSDDAVPCPRAAPCLVALDDTTAILYGGAEATPQGLHPLGDVWAFDLTTSAWIRLLGPGPDSTSASDRVVSPPPRNAATLTCISPAQGYSDLGYRDYVLAGGWHPFVQTWDDIYVLRIHKQ